MLTGCHILHTHTGSVGLGEVSEVLAALLEAPVLPAGGAVLDVAGTSVDAGTVVGQLAAALSSVGEKNATKIADLEAQRAQRAQQRRAESPASPAPASRGLLSFGSKVGGWRWGQGWG